MKESPCDGTKHGKTSDHSTPKGTTNNVNDLNSQKKGPNFLNKSQVFNKDGSTDSINTSQVDREENRLPKKDA